MCVYIQFTLYYTFTLHLPYPTLPWHYSTLPHWLVLVCTAYPEIQKGTVNQGHMCIDLFFIDVGKEYIHNPHYVCICMYRYIHMYIVHVYAFHFIMLRNIHILYMHIVYTCTCTCTLVVVHNAETDKTRKSKGLPNYLQLTKSAASKRVIKYVIYHIMVIK